MAAAADCRTTDTTAAISLDFCFAPCTSRNHGGSFSSRMALRQITPKLLLIATAALLASAAVVAVSFEQPAVLALIAALLLGAPAAYVAWHADPAYTLSLAIILSPFNGYWEYLGIPGALAPDRLLIVAGVAVVAFRSPAASDRPRLRIEAAHWALGLAVVYVILSAATTGSLTDQSALFRLLETFGILPFLVFAVAPIAFRTREQRNVLLAALIGLGAYLSVTAVFETVGLNSLVFPKYILDPDVGINFGRARGPFVQPATNGMAMFACALAAGIALRTWRHRGARFAAGSVGCLCLVGALLTMQRSVWLGMGLALIAIAISAPAARRTIGIAVAVVGIAFAGLLVIRLISGGRLSNAERDSGTVSDRISSNRAAINMIETQPLTGFGWESFEEESVNFYEQPDDQPLPRGALDLAHNVFLSYTADLGLLGFGIWAVATALVVVGALRAPASGELELWRSAFLAIAIFFFVAANFVPPKPFPTLILFLWAGVAWVARYEERDAEHGWDPVVPEPSGSASAERIVCGIAGQARFDGRPVSRDLLERMCGAIEHRGPDSRGIHLDRRASGSGSSGCAIIDLETGDQPIYNEDGSVAVVLNGEIYNFRELRARARAPRPPLRDRRRHGGDRPPLRGARGRTASAPLRGMFAFALWDAPPARSAARPRPGRQEAALLLARGDGAHASPPS